MRIYSLGKPHSTGFCAIAAKSRSGLGRWPLPIRSGPALPMVPGLSPETDERGWTGLARLVLPGERTTVADGWSAGRGRTGAGPRAPTPEPGPDPRLSGRLPAWRDERAWLIACHAHQAHLQEEKASHDRTSLFSGTPSRPVDNSVNSWRNSSGETAVQRMNLKTEPEDGARNSCDINCLQRIARQRPLVGRRKAACRMVCITGARPTRKPGRNVRSYSPARPVPAVVFGCAHERYRPGR